MLKKIRSFIVSRTERETRSQAMHAWEATEYWVWIGGAIKPVSYVCVCPSYFLFYLTIISSSSIIESNYSGAMGRTIRDHICYINILKMCFQDVSFISSRHPQVQSIHTCTQIPKEWNINRKRRQLKRLLQLLWKMDNHSFILIFFFFLFRLRFLFFSVACI